MLLRANASLLPTLRGMTALEAALDPEVRGLLLQAAGAESDPRVRDQQQQNSHNPGAALTDALRARDQQRQNSHSLGAALAADANNAERRLWLITVSMTAAAALVLLVTFLVSEVVVTVAMAVFVLFGLFVGWTRPELAVMTLPLMMMVMVMLTAMALGDLLSRGKVACVEAKMAMPTAEAEWPADVKRVAEAKRAAEKAVTKQEQKLRRRRGPKPTGEGGEARGKREAREAKAGVKAGAKVGAKAGAKPMTAWANAVADERAQAWELQQQVWAEEDAMEVRAAKRAAAEQAASVVEPERAAAERAAAERAAAEQAVAERAVAERAAVERAAMERAAAAAERAAAEWAAAALTAAERAAEERATGERAEEERHVGEAMARSMASLQADEEQCRARASLAAVPTEYLSAPPLEHQKQLLVERLFPLVQKLTNVQKLANVEPRLAGKLTGMLLEMDKGDLINLLESPDALNAMIMEAFSVLLSGRGVHVHEGGGGRGCAPTSTQVQVVQVAAEVKEAPAASTQSVLTLADVGDITGRTDVLESSVGGTTTCLVCMAHPKSHLAVPCGHLGTCGFCAEQMQHCPYCQSPVQVWVQARMVYDHTSENSQTISRLSTLSLGCSLE